MTDLIGDPGWRTSPRRSEPVQSAPQYHPQEGTNDTDTAARRIPARARCARPARSKPRLAGRPGLAAARLTLAWPVGHCAHLTIRPLSTRHGIGTHQIGPL